ncbi:hypothetical protein LSCM1_07119 [Leishmania martiniquensis]|uniref:Uncharacterized protein n=1 Tax=Leishmania martiniquensis TaxID=1580590 RepID=A0A836H3B1_9TRYP|nr:hypothetical protein LSCM1_07119 [Leishmania martiniquensis]
MILGVGAGTFAVLVSVGVAIAIALVGSHLAPQSALFFIVGCASFPFIVYGCILTAPHGPIADSITPSEATHYRERPLPSNTDLIDTFAPVRIVIVTLMAVATVSGLAFHLFTLMNSPPYEAPRVRCLRQRLEEAHPSWYR